MINRPALILFDWDNTLVDSWMPIYLGLNETLVHYGLEPWTMEQTKIHIHKSPRDNFQKILGDKLEESIIFYRSRYIEHSHNIELLSGAKIVLETINNLDIPTCIISNKKSDILKFEVKKLGLQDHFKIIVGSGDYQLDKPDPAIVDFTLTQIASMHINRKDIWFIGDSITDMKTAYNSGTVPILISHDEYNNEQYIDYEPHKIIKSHQELLAEIKKYS